MTTLGDIVPRVSDAIATVPTLDRSPSQSRKHTPAVNQTRPSPTQLPPRHSFESHYSDGERPNLIANLAALAAQRFRPPEPLHTVRYIAQVDKEGWMVRRSKVGQKTNFFAVLESTTLSILKNRSGPPRYQVNVRRTPVSVQLEQCEMHIFLPGVVGGKDRLLRLHIGTEEEAASWKHALDNAVNIHITDYYSFGKELGSGAYGDVVLAYDVDTNERRAVKIIRRGKNMKSQEHLEREIQVMKTISHPNIVSTYQIFDLKKTIYIVMEYVPGGDLFDFVAEHDCLMESQASQIIRSIFTAVEFLHRHSIVHRDLKPENILCVNRSWPLQIKVTDFGFASFLDPSNDQDNTMRTQVGTAYFMAPEIILNKGHGPPVDAWACGVILYTILTGRLPFSGKNTKQYFDNVIDGRILFPSILWKGISEEAVSLVKGLLNTDPNKRLTPLGALHHRWVQASHESSENAIRRDRSNLHSKRRRLFKARKAIIAVAMANKFKATIPQVVDKVGDSTKKVVTGIEQGVKKTADGVGEGIKKTATGVKKVSENIGEGTKKVAEEIGEGTKKVADGLAGGTKKVAEGIGTGVKKTVDGVETGARKVGEGMKKTGDGLGTAAKKTVDGVGVGLKKTGEGIEVGIKKTAEGVKKTADGVGQGLKKTSENIGDGLKKTADGVEHVFKKTGGGIGDGIKKTAEGVKKTADGVGQGLKKTGGGIGDGIKKTTDGVGHGLKRTGEGIGEGIKKTAGGVGQGIKKTADGVGHGLKMTGEGIGEGIKKTAGGVGQGLKKTGEGIRRGVEVVRGDRSRDGDTDRQNPSSSSQSGSVRHSSRRKPVFRRRVRVSRSVSNVSGSEQSRQEENQDLPRVNEAERTFVPSQEGTESLPQNKSALSQGTEASADTKQSSTEYYSAVEEHSSTEEGWSRSQAADSVTQECPPVGPPVGPCISVIASDNDRLSADGHTKQIVETAEQRASPKSPNPSLSKFSKASSGSSYGTNRPKLPPLSGITLGLTDDRMTESLVGDSIPFSNLEDPSDRLRRTAAMLLTTDPPPLFDMQ
ncbi:Calcium-dependent protein kinase 1 [Gracilariopsis chorda]|uniref:Calcium-dependent protein kinase 1 n=1 Tax=Gracilariopsis chorda TaxID=448386 RepID=A0A2V3IGB3_9FLOR|nr:Calcium-dependent protein kinase 1 [Gracilariopsis chorda]|eukprot:PXF40190.1 Calcium-dependent protein kinase 1 [Gracilariopsis chorda]